MLFLVLVLVLAAFGLLVTALVTATMPWAWVSVGISAVAAIVLLLDWSRRRRTAGAAPAPPPAVPEQRTTVVDAPSPPPSTVDPDGDAEPAEEDTDAADLLVVTDLDVEVRVVDERPRYHLAACRWLAGRPTLPVPVGEARQLGFTPCAVCTPDRVLAAARRTADAG
jgi:membrane protein implicated in regulation of membrane protease activity